MNPTDTAEANESGLDNPEKGAENKRQEQKVNPRDALVNEFQDRVDRERLAEANAIPIEEEADEPQHVVHSVPVAKEAPEKEAIAGRLQDFIVMNGEIPMFRTKVDGIEKLIPLDRAQQQVQKHEAADVRLQQASQTAKDLQVRETKVRLEEAALRQRTQQASLPNQGVNDQASLANEVKQLVQVLFKGTEDEAAAALTQVLGKVRQAPTAPAIDTDEIVTKTAATVRQQLSAEDEQKDMFSGYAKFKQEHAEILADPKLYRYADSLTTQIHEENPEWSPSMVLLEAGKQTKEWVDSLKGVTPRSLEEVPSIDRRVINKNKLRPMPTARTDRSSMNEVEQPQTSSQVLADIRKARGQG